MKTRTGFVSNSSSASFVVVWEYACFEENDSTTNILSTLLALEHLYDAESDTVKFDESYHQAQQWFEAISQNTKRSPCHKFESRFFTSMFNDYSDFERGASLLCMALISNPRAKIIGCKIENDW
jgi:hypothetical protein